VQVVPCGVWGQIGEGRARVVPVPLGAVPRRHRDLPGREPPLDRPREGGEGEPGYGRVGGGLNGAQAILVALEREQGTAGGHRRGERHDSPPSVEAAVTVYGEGE
jgi:hypothetical protein